MKTGMMSLGGIHFDEFGRVVLSDDSLREIEQTYANAAARAVAVAAASNEPGESNHSCHNGRTCDNTTNEICTNGALACDGASNTDTCVNMGIGCDDFEDEN